MPKTLFLLFSLFFLLPLLVSAALYRVEGSGAGWQTADRSIAPRSMSDASRPGVRL